MSSNHAVGSALDVLRWRDSRIELAAGLVLAAVDAAGTAVGPRSARSAPRQKLESLAAECGFGRLTSDFLDSAASTGSGGSNDQRWRQLLVDVWSGIEPFKTRVGLAECCMTVADADTRTALDSRAARRLDSILDGLDCPFSFEELSSAYASETLDLANAKLSTSEKLSIYGRVFAGGAAIALLTWRPSDGKIMAKWGVPALRKLATEDDEVKSVARLCLSMRVLVDDDHRTFPSALRLVEQHLKGAADRTDQLWLEDMTAGIDEAHRREHERYTRVLEAAWTRVHELASV